MQEKTTYDVFEELLKLNNVTPYAVSKATGISTAFLTLWKQGKTNPKLDKLQKLAEYFNVPVTHFTGETELATPDAKNILEGLIASLGADAQVNFSANDMSDDEKAFLLKSLQNSLEKFELYKNLKNEWQDENQ